MTRGEAIQIYLTDMRDEIFARQERNGMKASGFSAANTKVVVDSEVHGFLDGPMYLRTNFRGIGRRPGTMPPIKSIEEWIAIRHLNLSPWAVAMNILKKGTRVFYDARRGIDVASIRDKFKPDFFRNLKKAYIEMYKQLKK